MNLMTRLLRNPSASRPSRRRSRRAFRPEASVLEGRTLLAIDITSAVGLNLDLPPANATPYPAPGNPAPESIAVDSGGNVYLAGQFYNTTNFDTKNHSAGGVRTITAAGIPDFYVAKYDSSGNLLWVQTGGSTDNDGVYGLTVNSGRVLISGYYRGAQSSLTGLLSQAGFTGTARSDGGQSTDGFVMALGADNGSLLWHQDIQNSSKSDSNNPVGIAADSSGNVYITGPFQGQAIFSGFQPISSAGGSEESFVAKLDSSGNFAWVKQFTANAASQNLPAGYIESSGIAVDSAGNVITVGKYAGSVDLDPAGGSQQVRTSVGFASGSYATDIFVSKLDTNGNYVFAESMGGDDYDSAQGVSVDGQGNIYVSGAYTSYIDVSQNNNGTPVGVSFQPVTQNYTSDSQRPQPDPRYVLYGAATSMNRTSANYDSNHQRYYDIDSFALKLDSNGSYAWARGMNIQVDIFETVKTLIQVDQSTGLVYVAGSYSPDLGNSGTSTSPGTNAFIAQLSSTSGQYAPNAGTFLGFQTGGSVGSAPLTVGGVARLLNANDVVEGLAVGPGGKVYVSGVTPGKGDGSGTYSPTFGGTTLSNADTWIVTLNANTSYRKATDDFDGDGRTDVVVFRPETATFYVSLSSGGSMTQQWGWPNHDQPIQGDFDGDGRADFAVFRPETATFYILGSNGQTITQQWGWQKHDQPVSGDFDGDGKTDIAVYRSENATWYIHGSAGQDITQVWGWQNHDIPIPGDYDGDGKTDIAVFRPQTATFYIKGSAGQNITQQFGWVGHDIPIPTDFDGDGKTDIAVYRPDNSTFYLRNSNGSTTALQWGRAGGQDQPILGDYNGDGQTDLAVFMPDSATFFVGLSSGGGLYSKQWGWIGHDRPLAGIFYA